MKILFVILFIVICFSMQPVHASGWGDFARGFAETTAATQERRRCEETYSRSVCAQMEVDKKQREAQERQNQQMQWELQRQGQKIRQLEQQQQYQQNR